jgi:hypothetical protein
MSHGSRGVIGRDPLTPSIRRHEPDIERVALPQVSDLTRMQARGSLKVSNAILGAFAGDK